MRLWQCLHQKHPLYSRGHLWFNLWEAEFVLMMPWKSGWDLHGLIPGPSTKGRGVELWIPISVTTVSLRLAAQILSKEYIESVLILSSLGPRAEIATEIDSCTRLKIL